MTQPGSAPEAANLLRSRLHPDITEELISELVYAFYDRIRSDPGIGPIFEAAIGDNWDAHLAKMCSFWSSVMRVSNRYDGRPMVTHMQLKTVRPDHFEIWLSHFRQTAREVCPTDIAPIFIQRAETIAESFQLGMFFRPGQAGVPPAPEEGGAA